MPKLTVNCHILLKSFLFPSSWTLSSHSQATLKFGSQWMNSTSTTVCTSVNSLKAEVSGSTALWGGWHHFKALLEYVLLYFEETMASPSGRLEQSFPSKGDFDTYSLSFSKVTPTRLKFQELVPRQNLPVKPEANQKAFETSKFLKGSWACHNSKLG